MQIKPELLPLDFMGLRSLGISSMTLDENTSALHAENTLEFSLAP